MGSDDLHYKRRARMQKDLARKVAKRAPYDRVLIVCEGLKTEPNYLQELIDCLELNTANVEVDGNCGSSPSSVVAYAKKRYSEDKRKGDAFDRVFCVFDKDTHTTYAQAINEIAVSKPKDVFEVINSVPCFEYWLLLHFIFSTRPYVAKGAKSGCASLIDELHKYLPDYSKGDKGIFKQLMEQIHQAIAYSRKALNQAKQSGTDNPSTLMHKLVEYLQHLKD